MASDPSTTAISHLTTMAATHPDLSSHYEKLSTLYSQKLWHQLTVSSLAFLSDPSTLRSDDSGSSNHLALFQKVILPIDKKLNSLCLARMASLVAFSLQDGGGIEVLTPLVEQKETFGPAASLYLTSRLALLDLTILARTTTDLTSEPAVSKLESIAGIIDSNRVTLEQLDSENAVVHSAFYEMTMTYRKAVGPPESYYKEAIQYVSHTNLMELSVDKRRELGMDLCLSALCGEGVFNFGEIIASPIFNDLKGTPYEYLVILLECGARGDVLGFRSAADRYSKEIASQPSLVGRSEAVNEKITLLALVNMVFERPSLERTLQFDDIADRIGVTLDQVEWVVMRALSLHLIEGTMDQVEKSVDVTWVMPRVLSEAQMRELAGRFGEWAVKVSKTRDYMLEHTGGLLNQ